MSDDINSRSVLAGYNPEIVAGAHVVIVGLGALGQNVVQTLALTGIGRLTLIDCDEFEAHNATRSPFFPVSWEMQRYGSRKAPTVARRAFMVSTSRQPQIAYSDRTLQQLGDSCIRSADVVVAAVDNVKARSWLAERCRLYGKPMIEGGFSRAEFNFAIFSGAADTNCYRCFNPLGENSAPCTQYALAAERQAIIPGIQTTASVLAGFMAEQVMNALHGQDDAAGYRYYGNVRDARLIRAELQLLPDCPGEHVPLEVRSILPEDLVLQTVADLVTALRKHEVSGWVDLAEPAVHTAACTVCASVCQVSATESAWLLAPMCRGCGGLWPVSTQPDPEFLRIIDLATETDDETGSLALADLGIQPGGCILIEPAEGPRYLLAIPGDGEAAFRHVTGQDIPAEQRVAIRTAVR